MDEKAQILVIKHGALGDIIQGLDGFASLREGHRNAHLAVLTSPAFVPFMERMPFFDEVIEDKRASVFNVPHGLRLRKIFKRRWDRIYDFQCSKRTGFYLKHFTSHEVELISKVKGVLIPDLSTTNNRDRMLYTAELGGCPKITAEMGWLTSSSKIKVPENLVAFIPGSSAAKPEKRWSPRHYVVLANMLMERGFKVALFGTELDRKTGDAIMNENPAIMDYIGKTNLFDLASLLARSAMVVGNDTGPVFLAAKLGVPTVMLMSGHTDPAMSAPIGEKATWLQAPSVSDLTAEEVLAKLESIKAL